MLRELALFAGGGGGLLGSKLLGFCTVCAVEKNTYRQRILLARQRDGLLNEFPIWDDVCTFDGRPWRGHVDVITGGFPCQDISVAGSGKGLHGSKSRLWFEMARVIREVRPAHVLVENSPALRVRGLDVVLGNLAEMGFDARWGVLGAHNAGAPHIRKRLWIYATNPDRERELQQLGARNEERRRASDTDKETEHTNEERCTQFSGTSAIHAEITFAKCADWWRTEPGICRMDDGIPNWVDRIETLGDGQVPSVAALAWTILSKTYRVVGLGNVCLEL